MNDSSDVWLNTEIAQCQRLYAPGVLVGKNQYKRSLMTGGSEYGEYDLSALPPAKTIIRADKPDSPPRTRPSTAGTVTTNGLSA